MVRFVRCWKVWQGFVGFSGVLQGSFGLGKVWMCFVGFVGFSRHGKVWCMPHAVPLGRALPVIQEGSLLQRLHNEAREKRIRWGVGVGRVFGLDEWEVQRWTF